MKHITTIFSLLIPFFLWESSDAFSLRPSVACHSCQHQRAHTSSLFAEKDPQDLTAEELQAELNKVFSEGNPQDFDAEELQSQLNKITADTPMFSSWNEDNFDESALPIPMFTGLLVSLGSLGFTFYLFNIGINGFPDA
jgi:hypothetical protein